MRRLALALVALFAAAPLAAQPAPPETLLHIAERAEVTRAPDELVAALRAEARAPTAAAAQAAVNRAIAAAMERAGQVAGVTASTGAYWTGRVEDGRAFQASQGIQLRGGDAAALLDLAGALQERGLQTAGLHWQLTRDTARKAREEASRLALESLQRRAREVAAQLDMQVAQIREIRIDAPEHGPGPRPMMAASASARAAPPPMAVAEEAVVSATVSAVVVLRSR
jgi:uncharacterized protein YggE